MDSEEKCPWLEGFIEQHCDCFQVSVSMGLSEKKRIMKELAQEFKIQVENHEKEQQQENFDKAQTKFLFLRNVLEALKICIREKPGLDTVEDAAVITGLMKCIAYTRGMSFPPFGKDIALTAARCLLNLLYLSDASVDIFLQLPQMYLRPLSTINGVEWLGGIICRGGSADLILYAVRTLYMLLSKRDDLVDLCYTDSSSQDILGGSTIYHGLVTLAVAATYFKDGKIGLSSISLASLFQELVKVIYLLRSHRTHPLNISSLEQEGWLADDMQLLVVCIHVVIYPNSSSLRSLGDHLSDGVTNNLLDCKVAALQILMLVGVPDNAHFERALEMVSIRMFHGKIPSKSELHGQSDFGVPTPISVPTLLVPLLQSLLIILDLLLRDVVCNRMSGGLSSLTSTSETTRILPILTILTTLAGRGDDCVRSVMKKLILPFPGQAPSTSKENDLGPKALVEPLSLYDKLLDLMTCLEPVAKRYASEFFFALCNDNVDEFVEVTGFGNAVLLLQSKGLV